MFILIATRGLFRSDLISMDIFQEYPVLIRGALIVIGISVLTSIMVYMIIFFNRVRAAYIDMRSNEAQKMISDKLNNYLFFMESISQVTRSDFRRVAKEFNKIKKLKLKNKLVRQILMDQIIYFRKNFTDRTGRILSKLYQNLGLKEISLGKLHTRSWQIKAQGILELREMAPLMSSEGILPYTYSHNDDLRVEAQAAYIRLNPSGAFNFLNDAPEILLEWHQIILFDIVIRNEEITIPSFNTWLKSSNTSVITFSIKLIVHFMQFDSIPDLIRLIDHQDEQVQDRAINALGKLEAVKAENIMINKYPVLSISCKIEVLKALGRIGSGKYLSFLKAEFLQSENYYIRKYAMCSMITITKDDQEQILGDLPAIDQQQQAIINHCFDKLIQA